MQNNPNESKWKVVTVFYDEDDTSIAHCIPWGGGRQKKEHVDALTRRVVERLGTDQVYVKTLPNFVFGAQFLFSGTSYRDLALTHPRNGYRFPITESGMMQLLQSLNDGHHEHKDGLLEGLFTFDYDRGGLYVIPYKKDYWVRSSPLKSFEVDRASRYK